MPVPSHLATFWDAFVKSAGGVDQGDGSLSFWQAAHRQYFTRECARADREFSEYMLVACERFKVVFP